jgi:hypothetical protein
MLQSPRGAGDKRSLFNEKGKELALPELRRLGEILKAAFFDLITKLLRSGQ